MIAAHRFRGIGWFAGCVTIVLGFYLISLQVAAERKRLEDVNGRIQTAARDIRALETEFDTRANLAQLERWNGDTLALAAPTASQFVRDEAQLASMNVVGPATAGIQTASLVVPAAPASAQATEATPAAAAPVAAVQVAAVQVAGARAAPVHVAAVRLTQPAPASSSPAFARIASAARATAAIAKVRPEAVAMLDRRLLSDSTLGDILSGARLEAGHHH